MSTNRHIIIADSYAPLEVFFPQKSPHVGFSVYYKDINPVRQYPGIKLSIAITERAFYIPFNTPRYSTSGDDIQLEISHIEYQKRPSTNKDSNVG